VSAREFHLGDVLSVTTGRLLAPRGIEAMYDLLNFMTGDNLFTHQLPRACDECAPALLEQHPDLREVVMLAEFRDRHHVEEWLAGQVARFGETRSVSPLALGDHTRIHPLAELRMMAPGTQVIVVEGPGEVTSQ